MKRNLLAVGLVVVCALAAGCSRDDLRNTGGAAEAALESTRSSSHTFAFEMAGITASSRVERRASAGGAEMLHGTTSVALPGAPHPLLLEETAQLDASGRLVLATADLRSGPQAAHSVRSIRLDAAAGTVKVRDEKGERSWRVQADQPWIYEGLFADIAPAMADATAVQAWVAHRASRASTRLREVNVAAREDHLTVADQVAFADGPSEWIVLGDEVIETDADFIRALRWKALEAAGAEIQAAERSCEPGPV
jgi:hypothetical protein